MTSPAIPEPMLPTRQQLRDLHNFIDGQAYAALGPIIRIPGTPHPLRDEQRAVVGHAVQAVFAASQHLYQALWHRLGHDQPDPTAHATWAALQALATPWQNHPNLPDHLRPLLNPTPQP
ncbi:hypothetical protein [Streptomyces sp. NRRL S-350]|uniref:hypothetical protein n=1 Tax=Streptomyces sp. NRRL S-350 TaxID=1463902 RepID=UPI00131CA161|nr:hypothetical protein [Streptomyces sp. NRRL S-350]